MMSLNAWKTVLSRAARIQQTFRSNRSITDIGRLQASGRHNIILRFASSTASTNNTGKGALESRFLEGRTSLVTGSTSGIGLAIAEALAARGSRVLLNGFADDQTIKSIQEEFKDKYKAKADYIPVDLSKESEILAYIQDIRKLFPDGLDIIVNNAGVQHMCPIDEFPSDKWNALLNVLLTAPFHLIKNFLPDMRRRHWGRIINLASVHSIRASLYKAAYVSAKHGMAGLTKVVALETAGSGVTCNTLSPGFVDTPLLRLQIQSYADQHKLTFDEAVPKLVGERQPSNTMITPEQMAEMAVFLCTDASSQTTGVNIVIDGGWTTR